MDAPPAIHEDLQPGDRITSINGRASDQLSRQQLKELLQDAARYRSVTLNVSRTTRPALPELHRTYTLDLPLGSVRFPQAGVPQHMSYSPSYAPPVVRYLSCRHLAPHQDDSSQGRHSWPHWPGPSAPTGPQPVRYQPREEQLSHQLFYGSSAVPVEGVPEDNILSTIHEVPSKQPYVNSMHMVSNEYSYCSVVSAVDSVNSY